LKVVCDYRTLGLEPGASPEALKIAHRDLVQVWHPDRFAANPRLQKMAQEKLRDINAAYARLRSGTPLAAEEPIEEEATPPAPAPPQQTWLQTGLQAVGVAVAILALILSAKSFHRWLANPATPAAAAAPQIVPPVVEENAEPAPALRSLSQRPAIVKTNDVPIANGEEIMEPRGRSGVGTLTITNQTDQDAVATLTENDVALRMVYVGAGQQASIGQIGPGVYRLKLAGGSEWSWKVRDFTRNRTLQRFAGPFSFTQIQTPGQVRGDQYHVELRRDSAIGSERKSTM
jgi:DnaJ domain